MWYNPGETLSHNCLISIVTGARGGGKSFNSLELGIRRYLNKKEKFIYLRRTEAELLLCKDNLMNAINHVGHFPEKKFRVEGFDILMDKDKIGECVSLSKAYQLKSTAFPDYNLIIFDEFLIEDGNGRYLINEVEKLLGLMETVGRKRDEIRVLMLANNTSRINPYYDYFKIYPRENAQFVKKDDLVLLHMWDGKEYREEKAKTKLARLIQGTRFGDYLLDNKSLHDNFAFVERLSGNSRFWFTIKYAGTKFGVYWHDEKGVIWFSEKVEPKAKRVFAFDTESHEPNVLMMKQAKTMREIKEMKWAVQNSRCRFDTVQIKQLVYEILGYL